MSKIKAVLKMRHLEQLRDTFEDGPLFDIVYFDGQATDAPQYMREVVATKLCPKGLDESIVFGYDYLVLGVSDMENNVQLKPGEFVVFRTDGSFTTVRGFYTAEVIEGQLRLS